MKQKRPVNKPAAATQVGGGANQTSFAGAGGTLPWPAHSAAEAAVAACRPQHKVLVIGGYDPAQPALCTAELYDPTTGSWTPVGSLLSGRAAHAASSLPDGRVLGTAGAMRGVNAERSAVNPSGESTRRLIPVTVTRVR